MDITFKEKIANVERCFSGLYTFSFGLAEGWGHKILRTGRPSQIISDKQLLHVLKIWITPQQIKTSA